MYGTKEPEDAHMKPQGLGASEKKKNKKNTI